MTIQVVLAAALTASFGLGCAYAATVTYNDHAAFAAVIGPRRVGPDGLAQEAEGCSTRSLITTPDRNSEGLPRWRSFFLC
jgi:hypothetical protein